MSPVEVKESLDNSRKWERRAKENKAKLDEAAPKLAEWEKAQEAAKTELERANERATALEERFNSSLQRAASAEIRAALTGVVPDPGALIEDMNIGRFITAEGEIDSDAISALRGKYAAFAPPAAPGRMAPNPAQGTSAQPPLGLKERIAAAEKDGDARTAMRLKAALALENSK